MHCAISFLTHKCMNFQEDEEEGGDDDDEDDDGFFVPHGYLSDGEGALEDEVKKEL